MIQSIATDIQELGGRVFYVGGYCRDTLLNMESKDIDIEVYGINSEKLEKILSKYGNVNLVGKSFGIYKLNNIDFSLPRIEKKIGNKHTDFNVTVNHNLDYKSACLRRDFTINAIMRDVLTGEIIDPLDGLTDLKSLKIRACSNDSFIDDPLRLLRAAQFIARFNLRYDFNFLELSRSISINNISSDRIYIEFEKLITKGIAYAPAFVYLFDSGILNDLNYKTDERGKISLLLDLSHIDENRYIFNTLEPIEKLSLLFLKIISYDNEFNINNPIDYYLNKFSVNKIIIKKMIQSFLPDFIVDNFMITSLSSNELIRKSHKIKLKYYIIWLSIILKIDQIDFYEMKAKYIKYWDEIPLPLIRGDDLINLGITGEQIGKTLKIIRDLQSRGNLKTKEEAISFLNKCQE